MGIKPSYFPFMGMALADVLSELMGPYFEERREAWEDVFEEISADLVKGMLVKHTKGKQTN